MVEVGKAAMIFGVHSDTVSALIHFHKNKLGKFPDWASEKGIDVDLIIKMREEQIDLFRELTNPIKGLYWQYRSFFETEKEMIMDLLERDNKFSNHTSWRSFLQDTLWTAEVNGKVLPKRGEMAGRFRKAALSFLKSKKDEDKAQKWKERYS